MESVREVGFDSSEHIVSRQSGGSGDKFHQGANLSGRSTLGINNRVQQVGHAVDHGDPDSVSNHPFFSKQRPSTIKNSLAGIKAREQPQPPNDGQNHRTGNYHHEPSKRVGVPSCRRRHLLPHIPSGLYPTASCRRVRRGFIAGADGTGSTSDAGS